MRTHLWYFHYFFWYFQEASENLQLTCLKLSQPIQYSYYIIIYCIIGYQHLTCIWSQYILIKILQYYTILNRTELIYKTPIDIIF